MSDMRKITVMVPRDHADRIDQIASDQGSTVPDFIRVCVAVYLGLVRLADFIKERRAA